MRIATLALMVASCVAALPPTAANESPAHGDKLPEIGTHMPDGTVYAGLSMTTGKPEFVRAGGSRMPDGSIYAGISPDSGQPLYTTPEDAPVLPWDEAQRYCRKLSAGGHRDWHVPSLGELAMLYNNRADIGGFNQTGLIGNAPGYYWSSLEVTSATAWGQRFNDGYHEDYSKQRNSLLRCVRS
ncbi:MAG: DUF1566 domain-containing protein [Steroidobacteraceae bacterium]